MSSLFDRISGFFLAPSHDVSEAGEPALSPSTDDASRRSRVRGGDDETSVATGAGAHRFLPPASRAGTESRGIDPVATLRQPATGGSELQASRHGTGRDTQSTSERARVGASAFAAVLGAPGATVPVAAACAGELRLRERATVAVLCVWGSGEGMAGATSRAARRTAEHLEATGLAARACGRLVWVSLDPDADAAAAQAEQVRSRAQAPVVLAIAAPRPFAFEAMLDEIDVAIAVLPADAEDALRTLARWTLPAAKSLILPPLPAGPPRWTAMAGLARLRAMHGADS